MERMGGYDELKITQLDGYVCSRWDVKNQVPVGLCVSGSYARPLR